MQKTVSSSDEWRLWFACRVGRVDKKGRMSRTVSEEVRGISSSSYRVPGTYWAKFFMHVHFFFFNWELCMHLGSESQAGQPLRTMGTSVWLRENTALHYKLMPFPWSQTNRCRALGRNMQAAIHILNVWHAALQNALPKALTHKLITAFGYMFMHTEYINMNHLHESMQ